MEKVFEITLPTGETNYSELSMLFQDQGCIGCPEFMYPYNEVVNTMTSDFVLLKCTRWKCIHVAHLHCAHSSSLIGEIHQAIIPLQLINYSVPPFAPIGGNIFVLIQFKHLVSSRIFRSFYSYCSPENVAGKPSNIQDMIKIVIRREIESMPTIPVFKFRVQVTIDMNAYSGNDISYIF